MSYGFFRFIDAMPVLLAAITLPALVVIVLTYLFRKGADSKMDV